MTPISGPMKTKQDLIRFIQTLPDGWEPAIATWSGNPEPVFMTEDGTVYEGHQSIEIVIRGPMKTWRIP